MADYEYIASTGVIVPDTAALQAQVESEYKAALGDDLITTPDTPEGLLITAEVLARSTVVKNNAALANQINPNLAGATFLDAIWALTGGQRTVATRSTVTCQITGAVGTIVTTSVRFRSTSGDLWAVIAGVTIGAGGTADVSVRAVEYGPIPAPINTITQIVIGVIGLETVNNSAAAALGKTTQSDLSVRSLRKKTLAVQGANTVPAVTSALYETEGVKSLIFRENVENTSQVIDAVTLVAHSIYVCVDGGSDDDVGLAMLHKGPGCNYNGDTSVAVQDPSSGQIYNVKFDRPDLIAILIRVTCRVTNPLINPQTAVRTAVMAYVNGEIEGEDGFVVGGSVSPFELAGAVNSQYPNIYVQKLEIAPALTGIFVVTEIPIAIFEKATTTDSSISVLTI